MTTLQIRSKYSRPRFPNRQARSVMYKSDTVDTDTAHTPSTPRMPRFVQNDRCDQSRCPRARADWPDCTHTNQPGIRRIQPAEGPAPVELSASLFQWQCRAVTALCSLKLSPSSAAPQRQQLSLITHSSLTHSESVPARRDLSPRTPRAARARPSAAPCTTH